MGRRIPYTEAELAFLRENETTPRRELTAMFNAKFGRDVSVKNIKNKCKRMGLKTGRTGRFPKGNVPRNKGRKGYCAPGSEKGWFKKGSEPHNTKYLGHEFLTKDGYIMMSVDQTNPHTGYHRHYVLKHRYLWEKENGPIPEGMVLKCLDGNKLNTDPSNWKLITRSMNARLNGRWRDYDSAPDELKPLIMTTAKLAEKAAKRRKDKRETS